MKIGFIGQGWVGKHYADDFEKRGYAPVRYSLDEPYKSNRDLIKLCDIVFIAVPTPTTPTGFDYSLVREVLPLVQKEAIAVIKSTVLPGTTELLQNEFPDIYVIHSPEFLVEKTAAYDAANPTRNIIGLPNMSPEHVERAKRVLSVLPKAPFESIMHVRDAELVKYAGNCFLFTKVVYMNLLFNLVESLGGNWQQIRDALVHDTRIGASHTEPIHQSGRGAGGHCFIKDFEAFRSMYQQYVRDEAGDQALKDLAYKNIQLLADSKKDIELLEGVYGPLEKFKEWKSIQNIEL